MILDDAVKLLQDLGAQKVPGKELKNLHGVYAYMMVFEKPATFDFGGRKTLSTNKQRFITAGAYQESGKILIERTIWTIANLENIPVIIVIYGYFEPQLYLYHPDEILTKHRDDTRSMFGVVGIEFSLKLGEKIESLESIGSSTQNQTPC